MYEEEVNDKLNKKKHDSKFGQQKFYGLMLVIIFIILALLYKFYPSGNSEVANSDLQPIRKYISNTTGAPVEIYSGTISKISTKSITLSNGAKSMDFSISEQHQARFLNSNGKLVKPKIGDIATRLYLVEFPSKEKYVTSVFISISPRK